MNEPGNLEKIRVLAVNPFWRWAIIPLAVVGSPEAVAIPFTRRSSAEKLAREYIAEVGGGVMLLRRRGRNRFSLEGQIR